MAWSIFSFPSSLLSLNWQWTLLDRSSLNSTGHFFGTHSFFFPSRIVRLVGIIRDWANKNFREEEPRPDSFLERFRGPELQTVTTHQGDGKGDKDGEGKGTKYIYPVFLGAPKAPTPAMGDLSGDYNHYQGRCRAMPSSMIAYKELGKRWPPTFLSTLNISIVLTKDLSNSSDLLSMGNWSVFFTP